MLRVVIIGYGEMFTNLIAGALSANCEIVGIYRKEIIKYPTIIRKIKDIINPSIEYNYIKSYNLPEIEAPDGVNSDAFRKQLVKLNPDIILVGSWSEKFSKETFNIPKIATINAHPALLPKYRGPNPYFWVIKNKEQKSGITFHLMTENYDSGAILAQEEINVFPSDTGKTLKERTVLTARGVVCELLKDLSEDVIIPLQQKEENATYYSYPDSVELDFSMSTDDNFALIRASYPWYKPYFYHNNNALCPNANNVSIIKNSTNFTKSGTIVEVDDKTKTICILCGDNKILKMSNITHYNNYDKPFTRFYILRDVKAGDIIF